jgi:3-(3-hydroxy-phenyl)propionate hydroxylase
MEKILSDKIAMANGDEEAKETYDVAIVGFGPVGAVLANILGKAGLRTLIVERMAGIYDKPRAISIDHEVMRILQGVGLADAVDTICTPHTGTEYRGINNRLIKLFAAPKRPYPLGWTPNLMFIQPEFEPVLRAGAARFANVEIFLAHEMLSIEQDASEVRLLFKDLATDNPIPARARYVVACDGAGSPIRKQLGIAQDSLNFDEWWTVVDAWLKPDAVVPELTTQFCLPTGPTTYVVGPRGLRRWEIKILPHEDRSGFENLDNVRERLAPFVDPGQIDIWRAATYRFHALIAHEWRRGRIFLAGDAAHQMPPFMAQGLCSGIRDAGNLGWKLAAVLQGRAHQQLLASYEIERKPHLRELVETTKKMGEIIGELDCERARRRDEAMGSALEAGQTETLRQRFIPDLTDGLLARDSSGTLSPGAGTLFVQPNVIDERGRKHRLDDFIGDHFAIVTVNPDHIAWLGPDAAAKWAKVGGKSLLINAQRSTDLPAAVHWASEEEPLLADWLELLGPGVVVVRPDKYVFGIARDPELLERMIDAIFETIAIC